MLYIFWKLWSQDLISCSSLRIVALSAHISCSAFTLSSWLMLSYLQFFCMFVSDSWTWDLQTKVQMEQNKTIRKHDEVIHSSGLRVHQEYSAQTSTPKRSCAGFRLHSFFLMTMLLLLLTQYQIFSWTSPCNQHQVLPASTAELHADVPLERLRNKK